MQRGPKTFRLLAGILCLLAYSAGSSGALPELCALTAAFDRSHAARIELRDQAVTVVLAHERNSAGQQLHRHGSTARWLCALADQHSGGADHRLKFCSSSAAEFPGDSLKLTNPPSSPALECTPLLPPTNEVVAEPYRLSISAAGSLFSAGSTVLLI